MCPCFFFFVLFIFFFFFFFNDTATTEIYTLSLHDALPTSHSRIPYLPARIEGLSALAMNLWWSWSREARGLFRSIDEALWHVTRHNPLELLCRVDPARIAACASDSDFLRRYDAVMAHLTHETSSRDTWFAQTHPELNGRPVAYFCAEFGLHASVPIYS